MKTIPDKIFTERFNIVTDLNDGTIVGKSTNFPMIIIQAKNRKDFTKKAKDVMSTVIKMMEELVQMDEPFELVEVSEYDFYHT